MSWKGRWGEREDREGQGERERERGGARQRGRGRETERERDEDKDEKENEEEEAKEYTPCLVKAVRDGRRGRISRRVHCVIRRGHII